MQKRMVKGEEREGKEVCSGSILQWQRWGLDGGCRSKGRKEKEKVIVVGINRDQMKIVVSTCGEDKKIWCKL